MSSLAATQSDGYYLPPEYFESGAYRKQSRNEFAAASASNGNKNSSGDCEQKRIGHNQWLKYGIVRLELPKKAICLGCRQSVGKGTRFNAKKITTDEHYFSTKIYEFQLCCRNCLQPWVIRTNPQHRGFDYVSGVKRQAGQEEILVTSTSGRNNPMEIPSGCYDSTDRRSLDNLEMAEVVRNGTKQALTEIEELEQIRQRNDVSASVNDADANASIRKSFRSDRKEKRRRLGEAKEKGWRDGMMVLPTNDHDVLAANDNCYGRPAEAEKRKLSAVRKSSIFSSNRARGNKNGRKRPRSSDRRADDTTTKVSCASPVRSGNFFVSPRNHTKRTEIAAASELTTNPVVDEVGSSSSLATVGIRPNTAKKKTLQLRRGENGLTILGKEKIIALKKSSFSQMMAAYGSDEDS